MTSFENEIIKDKPNKYKTIIDSRVLSRKIKMKLDEYTNLEDEYDNIIQSAVDDHQKGSGGWKRINGGLKQISAAGKDYIWGINKDNYIYNCKKPCDDSDWKRISGGLNQLTGGDKEVWGVNTSGSIYKKNQDGSGSWKRIRGRASNVSQGGGYVWQVGTGNSTWYCREPCNGEWSLASKPKTNLGWKALGNWKDNGNRMLPTYKGIYAKAGCNQQCQGEKYFSLQDGNGHAGQCFCGNDWNRITSLGTCDQDNKITGGAWCNTVYNTTDGSSYIPIHVGTSNTNNKVVTLPHNDMTVNKWQVNAQNPGWGDRFSVKVNGNQLTVTRIDADAGWGEDLYLEGVVQPDASKVGPPMVQLSCNNKYVYGLDTNKNAWRRPVNGSGTWEKFGNTTGWQFNWINASNNTDVFGVGLDRYIYKTDIDGKQVWTRVGKPASGVKTVSGDPDNETYYITNTSDSIYRHDPLKTGGLWYDIPDENYQMGMVNNPEESTDDWKYLGKHDNIDECKLAAVRDRSKEYASVVYYPEDSGWNKSCFGGVKGGKTNPQYQSKTITSLAPNGTSRMGGTKGMEILKQMKKIHNEIKKLQKEQNSNSIGLLKTKGMVNLELGVTNSKMETILEKLDKKRIAINKILDEPDAEAVEEDGDIRRSSSYVVYLLWILIVILTIGLVLHLYTTDSEAISPITYIFVSVWAVLLFSYYYRQLVDYGGKTWDSISDLLVDDV